MSEIDELPYFGTKANPTNVADDDDIEIDPTAQTDLIEIKKDMEQSLASLGLDVKQSAADVKIEAIANQKVRIILQPIVETIDEKLKIMRGRK